MKNLISLFVVILLYFNIIEGQDTIQSWLFRVNFGIEKHDKRLFDYSEKEMLLALQPEEWGTYHFGLSLSKKLKQVGRFSLFEGVGISYENATFLRPFDHYYFDKDILRILLHENQYIKIMTPVPSFVSFRINNQLFFNFELTPAFIVYRRISNTLINSDLFPYSKFEFQLEKVKVNFGLAYSARRFSFGLNYRIINYQKIDKVIFNHILKDPRVEKWELYNPLQFNFNVGFVW